MFIGLIFINSIHGREIVGEGKEKEFFMGFRWEERDRKRLKNGTFF